MTIDPITLEVIRNGLVAVAEEMNANLIRTGYSPNIKERQDCSCAVFDASGDMVSQAENIPVHLGAMPFSVAAAIDEFPIETLAPGDGILLNDPFRGGAHLPDLTLITPIFVEGTLTAFAANRAHHADVGGSRAGSVAADSSEIYQEGIRIPPVRLLEKDRLVEDVVAMILANTRAPDERRGDLRAQAAANRTGRRRVEELVTRHGADTIREATEAVKTYSERRMRSEIAGIPDGTYEFSDVIEDDGRGNTDLTIAVEVRIDGETVAVDFEGCDAQTEGAVNAVFAVTASATYYALRCLTDPEIPPNAGCYRPIDISAPSGSIVHAEPPAAVVGGNLETSQRIVDVILGAFAGADPDRTVAASQGTMNNVTLGGVDNAGQEYAFYETQAGGYGASGGQDGMDGVQVHMTNTRNTPIEVLETAYPLRVRRYSYRPDSGGAGEFRGGLGLRRDIEVQGETTTCSLLAERRRRAPFGIAGGGPGERGEDYINQEGDWERIEAKSTHQLTTGDVLSVRTPGGGGFGDPDDRALAAIDRDLREGKLTQEAAAETYGYRVE